VVTVVFRQQSASKVVIIFTFSVTLVCRNKKLCQCAECTACKCRNRSLSLPALGRRRLNWLHTSYIIIISAETRCPGLHFCCL